jgi:hypothetical protein
MLAKIGFTKKDLANLTTAVKIGTESEVSLALRHVEAGQSRDVCVVVVLDLALLLFLLILLQQYA